MAWSYPRDRQLIREAGSAWKRYKSSMESASDSSQRLGVNKGMCHVPQISQKKKENKTPLLFLNYSEYRHESDGAAEPVGWRKFGEAISLWLHAGHRASCFPTASFSRNEHRCDRAVIAILKTVSCSTPSILRLPPPRQLANGAVFGIRFCGNDPPPPRREWWFPLKLWISALKWGLSEANGINGIEDERSLQRRKKNREYSQFCFVFLMFLCGNHLYYFTRV